MANTSAADDRALKAGQAENFDSLNSVLAGSPFDRHLRFFNFGYQVLPGEEPVGPGLGRLFPNRESAQLLFQVVGDADLAGATIVEVGCGRGGNLWLIDQHLGPAQAVGLDIAGLSVRFAQDSRRSDRTAFVQGDAEVLPFATGSVDAVLSVETSCTYPDLGAFLAEVARVVAPGGWFLYTDLADRRVFGPLKRVLDEVGFGLVTERDITPNVRASREARAERQKLAFGAQEEHNAAAFGELVATDGSTLARYLQGDERLYHLLRLRRRPGPVIDRPRFTIAESALIRECAAETVRLLALSSPPAASAELDRA